MAIFKEVVVVSVHPALCEEPYMQAQESRYQLSVRPFPKPLAPQGLIGGLLQNSLLVAITEWFFKNVIPRSYGVAFGCTSKSV